MVDIAQDIVPDLAEDVADIAEDMAPGRTARPPGTLSYAEATEATGLSRRHLRRLVAAGTLEAVDMGGRRWVTTASLLAAGHTLRGPSGWEHEEGHSGGQPAGHPGGPSPDLTAIAEEVESLRRRLAVAEALAAERARELDRVHSLATRAMAMLPPAREAIGGDTSPDASRPRPRRWRRRSKA